MNRRAFLAAAAPTLSGLLSGCLGGTPSCSDDGRWPPSVEVEDLVVQPGGFDVLDIEVPGITGFQFDTRLYHCGDTDAPVRFGDVETSPEIDAQMDSCPPIWTWDDCSNVTVHAPVRVSADASPGEYEYGFRILETVGERNTYEYEDAITVAED